MGLGRRDGNAGRGTTHRRPVRQPWWRGCTRGYPDDEPPRRLRVQVEQYCSVKFPRSQDGSITCTERPDWRRRARERQRRHPRRSPNFRFPDRAREREGPGTRAIEPHLAKVPRRPLFRPRGQRRFKVRPSVRPGRSVASVRSREKRPLKLLATMTDRKCGGEP